jgi:hypothetical protein
MGCGCKRLTRAVQQGVDSLSFQIPKFSAVPFASFCFPQLRSLSAKMCKGSIGYPVLVPDGRILPSQPQTNLRSLTLALAQSFWAFAPSKASYNLSHAFPGLTHLSLTGSIQAFSLHFFKQLPCGLVFLELSNQPFSKMKPPTKPLKLSEIVPTLPLTLGHLSLSPAEGLDLPTWLPRWETISWPPNLTCLDLNLVNLPDILHYLPPALTQLDLALRQGTVQKFPLTCLPPTMTSISLINPRAERYVTIVNQEGLPLHSRWRHFEANLEGADEDRHSPWEIVSWLPPSLETYGPMKTLLSMCTETMHDHTPDGEKKQSFETFPLPKSLRSLERARSYMLNHLPPNLQNFSFSLVSPDFRYPTGPCPLPTSITSLEYFPIANVENLEWLKTLTSLTFLQIGQMQLDAPIPGAELRRCLPSSLKQLCFSIGDISSPECFIGMGQQCPQLEAVTIFAFQRMESPQTWASLMECLPKNLKSMKFSISGHFWKMCMDHWMPRCPEMEQLEELEIDCDHFQSHHHQKGEKGLEWMGNLPKNLKLLRISAPGSWAYAPADGDVPASSSSSSSSSSDLDPTNDAKKRGPKGKSPLKLSKVFHHLPNSLTDFHITLAGHRPGWKIDHFSNLPRTLTSFSLSCESRAQLFDSRSIVNVLPPSVLNITIPFAAIPAVRDALQQHRTRLFAPFLSRHSESNLLAWLNRSPKKTSESASTSSPGETQSSSTSATIPHSNLRSVATLWTSPEYQKIRDSKKRMLEDEEEE